MMTTGRLSTIVPNNVNPARLLVRKANKTLPMKQPGSQDRQQTERREEDLRHHEHEAGEEQHQSPFHASFPSHGGLGLGAGHNCLGAGHNCLGAGH